MHVIFKLGRANSHIKDRNQDADLRNAAVFWECLQWKVTYLNRREIGATCDD